MNNIRQLLVIAFILVICMGCAFEPWTAEDYVNKETENVFVNQKMPDDKLFSDYYIGSVFLKMSLHAHNETNVSGNSPYYMLINAYTSDCNVLEMTITNVSLESNIDRMHLVNNLIMLPLTLQFGTKFGTTAEKDEICKNLNKYHPVFKASFLSKSKLDLKFDQSEEITIKLDIAITFKDKRERKIITYQFVPKLRKGYFQWITA